MNKVKANEHSRFRQSKAWKDFRIQVIQERDCRCEMCGIKKKSKQLQLHHLFPLAYEDLTPSKFKVLCAGCHDLVEKYARRLHGKKANEIANRANWDALLIPFLPYY